VGLGSDGDEFFLRGWDMGWVWVMVQVERNSYITLET